MAANADALRTLGAERTYGFRPGVIHATLDPIVERLCTVLALTLLALSANVARAQQPPGPEAEAAHGEGLSADERARELYLRGDRLYAEGDYGGAIAAFKESYALSGRPLLLFDLANAYERAGRYEHAIAALRRYAPHAPAYEHASIARRIASLEARLDPPPPEPAEPPAAAPPPASSPAKGEAEAEVNSSEERRTRLRTTGWVMTAVGAAGLVAGAVAGGLALRARNEARGGCVDGICEEGASDALTRDDRAALAADVALSVGAASLATGVVLLLWVDAPAERAHADTASGLRLTGAFVGYRGQF